ncbi:MAG: peptide chain release factor N(5)-glutamine methyltransferase [Actinomycetota bacterium]|nr:peptide chain release factor N(5)-glutamine methyltransferase [Actinomycetota bacterium]
MRTTLAQATARLAAAGVPSPRVDAIALAEHALGVPQLILAMPPTLPAAFEDQMERLVRRRASREPLQHIVGYAAFRYLTVRVQAGIFLPRPETEVVAQQAVDEARRLVAAGKVPLVIDLCAGSGVIALSVAVEVPGSCVVAVDADPAAVALTRVNATPLLDDAGPDTAFPATELPHTAGLGTVVPTRSGVDSNGLRTVRVEMGDVSDPALLADLDGKADILISNPPYIPDDGIPPEREVADHDPPLALFGGGPDGLDVPRHVVLAAVRLLRPGGLFVMEHADVQGAAVRKLVDRTNAFSPATTHQDLTGRDRFVVARRRAT